MSGIGSKNSGITLIALIVTIVLMMILGTVAVYSGKDSYEKSKVMKFIAEMQALQERVDMVEKSNETRPLGEDVTTNQKAFIALVSACEGNELQTGSIVISDFEYFTKENAKRYFDIENITSDIIINFNTREIISVDGIVYNDEQYFTQYKLPGGQKIVEKGEQEERNLSQMIALTANIDGLNATINIGAINIKNGKLEYKVNDDTIWKTIMNNTENGNSYSVHVSISGTYTFRLTDNNNPSNYVEREIDIMLANSPKYEEGMEEIEENYNYTSFPENIDDYATVTKNGKKYVWIPRYAKKGNVIKFIKGNSSIATDNTFLDNSWIVPEGLFNINDSGIWYEITENQTDLVQLVTEN